MKNNMGTLKQITTKRQGPMGPAHLVMDVKFMTSGKVLSTQQRSGKSKFTRRAKSAPYQVKIPHNNPNKKIESIDISKSDDAKNVLLMITTTPDGFEHISFVCRSIRSEAIHFGHSDKGTEHYVERYEIIKSKEPTITVLTPDPDNLIYHLSVVNLVGGKEVKAIHKFFNQQLKRQNKAQRKEKLDEAPKSFGNH